MDLELEALLAEKARRQAGTGDLSLDALMAEKARRAALPVPEEQQSTGAYLLKKLTQGALGAAQLPEMVANTLVGGTESAANYLLNKLPGLPTEARAGTQPVAPIGSYVRPAVESVVGVPNDVGISKPLQYAGAAAEAAPYATYGGGLLSALMAGVGGKGGGDVAELMMPGSETAKTVGSVTGAVGGGVIPGLATSGARALLRAVAGDDLAGEASRIQQQAIGATKANFKKSIKTSYAEPGKPLQSDLSKSLDYVLDESPLKDIPLKDAQSLEVANRGIMNSLKSEVMEYVGKADEALAGKKVFPNKFPKAEAYIAKLSKTEADDALADLAEIKSKLREKVDGTFSGWQKEKEALQAKVYGEAASPKDLAKQSLEKYVASDVKSFIEDGVGALVPGSKDKVAALNNKIGKHADTERVLRSGVGASEGATRLEQALRMPFTTGAPVMGSIKTGAGTGAGIGLGLGALIGQPYLGASIGGLLGGATGAGVGTIMHGLATPEGKIALAKRLQYLASPAGQRAINTAKALVSPGVKGSAIQSALIGMPPAAPQQETWIDM